MRKTNKPYPAPGFIAGNCACSPDNFCLWHYGMLTDLEKHQVRKRLNVRVVR